MVEELSLQSEVLDLNPRTPCGTTDVPLSKATSLGVASLVAMLVNAEERFHAVHTSEVCSSAKNGHVTVLQLFLIKLKE